MPVLWCSPSIIVVIAAATLDFCVGDPWGWPHPVQAMGWVVDRYQTIALRSFQSPIGQRFAGIVLGVGLPVMSGAIAAALVYFMDQLHPALGAIVAAILLASCFAGRSLRRAAEDVLFPLQRGNLEAARQKLGLYVGRDTQDLPESEVLRAIMETISENATDGVMAPLFYGLWGLGISPAAGVGMAIAYKALSTLDSMIGYRTAPYTYLGWFSARCEDAATWLPCRLTVMTIALLSGRPKRVWQLCSRDAPADPSPNAGWSECAYAAALGVQLGGKNVYRGKVKYKPLLADPLQPILPQVIQQGLGLTRRAFLVWLAVGVLIFASVNRCSIPASPASAIPAPISLRVK